MLFIIGAIVVFGCVVTGYTMHGGNLAVLWQPTEFIIIVGAAIGSFLISNPVKVVKKALKSLKLLFKGSPFKKADFQELLVMLYTVFKLMKSKGLLELESHIENPHDSAIFNQFPKFLHNHHAVDFFCDYLRLMTMGIDDHYQIEDQMERDLDSHHLETDRAATAWSNMGDAMPALGIVAAVLGVIVTMGSITEPPEILGHLIGAALVGTFLGVLLSYGFISPISKFLGIYFHDEGVYYAVIKTGLIAHLKGNAPAVSVEFARNTIPGNERPSFKEVEDALNSATPG